MLGLPFNVCSSPFSEQSSWISVDFDNWRDWAHEEDDGKAEFDNYMDVSDATVLTTELLYLPHQYHI